MNDKSKTMLHALGYNRMVQGFLTDVLSNEILSLQLAIESFESDFEVIESILHSCKDEEIRAQLNDLVERRDHG